MVRKASPLMIAPIGVWAISLPIPFFSLTYFFISLFIMIPYILYILYVDVTGKNKSKNQMSYAGYLSLLLICIFFGGPAFKLYSSSIIIQIIIVLIAFVIMFIVQKNNKKIADSLTAKENRNITFIAVYYGIGILLITAGGGGYFLAAEAFAARFGTNAMNNYFSILLLLIGYWLLVATQSATSRFTTFNS